MPWVDPETIGPQNISYYAWPFRGVRDPQHLPDERGPVRARDHAALDDGRLHRRGRAGHGLSHHQQRASARRSNIATTFARFEPLGTGALARSDALLDPERDEQPAGRPERRAAVQPHLRDRRSASLFLGVHSVALLDDRAGAVEAAPAQACAKREAARGASSPRPLRARRRQRSSRATQRPSRWAQFMARLRIEMRQVLTSPGTDRPDPVRRSASRAVLLWFAHVGLRDARSSDRSRRRSTGVRGGFGIIILLIAAFYGGELVWRERDRKINEIIDSTAGPELGDDRAEDPRDLRRAADRQRRRRWLTGIVYQLVEGAHELGIAAISRLVHRARRRSTGC